MRKYFQRLDFQKLKQTFFFFLQMLTFEIPETSLAHKKSVSHTSFKVRSINW